MIADETKLRPGTVRNVLVTLSELELVKMPARGIYEISELGQSFLKKKETEKK
jgi:predicted transcriptional regulator